MKDDFCSAEQFSVYKLPILFLDFDGTISERDVIDAILAEFADERWLEIEADWISGKIGSRECLRKQFELVTATPAELDEFLDTIRLDAGLPDLFNFVQTHGITAHIVSDGFSYYIKKLLFERHAREFPSLLNRVCIWANQLIPHGKSGWRAQFPYFERICAEGCATCKPAVIELVNRNFAPTVFVGDGLSDLYAAQTADFVFAKNKLAKFCRERKINFFAYQSLGEIARALDESLREAHALSSPLDNLFDIVPALLGT
jgi:2-hydroxy-3-keto-5-methylthiopentenyl-1-phosphate phosphatase